MAGNEIDISRFLLENLGKITLKHFGLITEIGAPNTNGYTPITTLEELKLISTEGSEKKADIYINGIGVSLKQSGGSFPFNRLQRAELLDTFRHAKFKNPEEKLERIDTEVNDFHNGIIKNRSRPWENLFEESDFKQLVKFLMTEGSPNLGYSKHPAKYILEAPKTGINDQTIEVFSFEEYFDIFKLNIFFSIRRQWIGQSSKSEHGRAIGLAKKIGNKKWVYDNVSGEPRVSKSTGQKWRAEVAEKDRKTVYIIFVEKK